MTPASGAAWVSLHRGGGVGIGNSLHAGQVSVADGSAAAGRRLERVLTNDPGIGVARHADAGHPQAIETPPPPGIPLPIPEGETGARDPKLCLLARGQLCPAPALAA